MNIEDFDDISRGIELSFYDEEIFSSYKPRRKDTPYPLSAKRAARKLFLNNQEMTFELPIWIGEKDDCSWENSSTESEQATQFPFMKTRSPVVANLPGQEYLDDIYEAINEMGNPKLLEALESFITTTSDTLSQKNRENERLDTALRRATEKNSENARNLEEEMEQQITMLEEKIREEEKRRAERAIMEAQIKIEEKDKEMKEIKEKWLALETSIIKRSIPMLTFDLASLCGVELEERMNSQATTKENESEEDLKEKDLENEALRSKLRECQTQMAVFRTEIAQLKNEYDEQGERLSRERQTVLRCVHEQESLTRQLQLLHEANRKLHDTNDDLRAALENRLRSSDDSMSPSKRNSFVGSPIGAYKKNPLSRSFDNQSTDSSRSAVTSPIMNGGDELSTMSTPPFRPLESEFNESSLMSELMAADEQGDGDDDIETEGILNTSMGLPEGILPLHNIETDYVDDDAETDPEFVENEKLKEAFKNMTGKELENESLQAMPAKEKEQMMEQLRILCETNRRLSQCNDELRDALGLLSKKRKDKKSPRSSSRSSHSDYMSSPSRSNSRSSSINSRNSIPDRPPSSSSPRKRRSNSRKPSHSATSSEGETENVPESKCECGTELDNGAFKCKNCGKIHNPVNEDVVEPVVVEDDKSEPWLDPKLFPEEECSCKDDGSICPQCTEKRDVSSIVKDASVQADLSLNPETSLELDRGLHVCEGESCICIEEDSMVPLDKSVQVSDVLLDISRDKNEQIANESKELVEDDLIIPDSDVDVHHERDVLSACPDCGNPIQDSNFHDDICTCIENQAQIVPPTPFQDNKVDNEFQKSQHHDMKSSFPDYSDVTSNYTDRETDVQTRVTEPSAVDTDSLANAARIRQGIHPPTEDESASDITSGINSSYSVIQNIDEELSMFAHQRESDEDVDEDDMTIGELQRIKEMTSSGSDLESDTDSTFGEKQRQGDLDTTDQNSNENLGEPERMYKLVLAGDAAVGKSSFILRLCKNRFYPSLNSTLGVDFQMKTLNVDGHTIALQLWDTAGQERFRSIAKSYFRRVDGVLLLYDVTSEQSFLNVRDWMESIQESSNKPVPIMLCGNKIDLRKPTAPNGKSYISREQGERLAKEIDAFFIETSSRKNTNIAEAVLKLARKLRSLEDTEIRNGGMTLGDNGNDKKKSGCC
eukprot:gene12809-3548_t